MYGERWFHAINLLRSPHIGFDFWAFKLRTLLERLWKHSPSWFDCFVRATWTTVGPGLSYKNCKARVYLAPLKLRCLDVEMGVRPIGRGAKDAFWLDFKGFTNTPNDLLGCGCYKIYDAFSLSLGSKGGNPKVIRPNWIALFGNTMGIINSKETNATLNLLNFRNNMGLAQPLRGTRLWRWLMPQSQ